MLPDADVQEALALEAVVAGDEEPASEAAGQLGVERDPARSEVCDLPRLKDGASEEIRKRGIGQLALAPGEAVPLQIYPQLPDSTIAPDQAVDRQGVKQLVGED